jgi:Caspase domain
MRCIRVGRTHFGLVLLGLAILSLAGIGDAGAKTLSISPAGDGQVRALVIGIDRYQNVPPLKGAVADAQDVASALRNAGVSDLTILIDRDANRRNIDSAMTRLLNTAAAGDLVVLSIAGHGAQARERVKGSEPDGMDEVFLLSGFSAVGRGNTERIIDDEFNGWLSQLNKKGVDVLFVADTCHGGGLTRGPQFDVNEQSYRFAGTVALDQEENTPIAGMADATVKTGELPHVTFLGAADKYNKVPEVKIPGIASKRGALSYAFARAIDSGRNGPVTRQELFGFSRQVAYQYADTRQSIVTEPQGESAAPLSQVIFRLKTDGVRLTQKQSDPVRVRVNGGDRTTLQDVPAESAPFRIMGAGEDADLIWDVGKRQVYSGSGDLIANCPGASDLGPIIERFAALSAIARLTELNYQNIRLLPNDGRFRRGQIVTFRASGLAKKYLILFDISGDGMARFLYPREKNDTALIADDDFSLPLKVGPPFGSDHVTAVVSDSRLEDLERAISALDGQKVPGKIVSALFEAQQSNPDMRVGTAALFTSD